MQKPDYETILEWIRDDFDSFDEMVEEYCEENNVEDVDHESPQFLDWFWESYGAGDDYERWLNERR